jgi:fructose-specific phosphotransferase system IIC component
MQRPDDEETRSARLGPWGWFAIAAMIALLAAAIAYSIHAWRELPGGGISTTGWVFLVLGAIVTTVFGAGLMLLLFYSSRKGRDF